MTLGSELAAVFFGLASAATWGVADFSGGLATRRTPVLTVTLLSQTAGLILLMLLALARTESLLSLPDMAWGAAAGVAGLIGLIGLYRAMAIGQMGIAAPVTAVLAAGLPVVVGAFTQGLPDLIHLLGFALALAGIWLISRPQDGSGRPHGLGLAVMAGLGFGCFLTFIAQVDSKAVFWPLVTARAASIALMIGFLVTRPKPALPAKNVWLLILLAGVMDAGGNAFFVLAEQAGRLDVASTLASLYPATTVLLALLVLKEKIGGRQNMGILLALIAILLIAL
ncbi:MAG: EamA family transporter [Chloroflexota bacterium]